VLEPDRLTLVEIADALQDQTDYEHAHLIDSNTGEMYYWTRDGGIDGNNPVDLDEVDEALVVIEPIPSYVWYQDMVDFAEGISDDRAGRRLGRELDGKGAFRRFRIELEDEYPHLVSAWHAFREARALRRAVEWLLDNTLIDDAHADRYLEENPDPELP
jgi:hypothetical protein